MSSPSPPFSIQRGLSGLTEYEGILREADRIIAEKDRALNSTIAKLFQHQVDTEKILAEHSLASSAMEQALADKDKELDKKEKLLTEHSKARWKAMTEKDKEIAEKDKLIAEKDKLLVEKEQRIKDLEETDDHAQNTIKDLEGTIEDLAEAAGLTPNRWEADNEDLGISEILDKLEELCQEIGSEKRGDYVREATLEYTDRVLKSFAEASDEAGPKQKPGRKPVAGPEPEPPQKLKPFFSNLCRCRTHGYSPLKKGKLWANGPQCTKTAGDDGLCNMHRKKIAASRLRGAGDGWKFGFYDEPRPERWGDVPGDIGCAIAGRKIPWKLSAEEYETQRQEAMKTVILSRPLTDKNGLEFSRVS